MNLPTFALAALCSLASASAAAAFQSQGTAASNSEPRQTQEQTSTSPTSDSAATTPREVGGRLVVSGETVEVKGNPDLPASNSTIASKIDVPLIETPRSVSILDRGTLDDMAAINISHAHDYAVGVIPLDERGPASARGFPLDFYDLRRDGLRTYSWSVREPVALERIQYLRGPAAVLYGDGSPGALVNLILKKPLPVRQFEFGATMGSLGFQRVTGSATGPLNADRSMRYLTTGAAEWLENGFDNNERRLTFLPSLAFDFGSRATMSVRGLRVLLPARPQLPPRRAGDACNAARRLLCIPVGPEHCVTRRRVERLECGARRAIRSHSYSQSLAARLRALHENRRRPGLPSDRRTLGGRPVHESLSLPRDQHLE
jgi:outer membrane receptor protein involved in Fe transport